VRASRLPRNARLGTGISIATGAQSNSGIVKIITDAAAAPIGSPSPPCLDTPFSVP
jgi:hypothetical protein